MEQNDWKKTFDRLNPSEEQTARIWEKISAGQKGKSAKIGRKPMKYVAAAVLTLVLVSVAGAGVNAATGGVLASVIKGSPIGQWLGLESEEEILEEAENSVLDGMGGYAPEILYVDAGELIFGNLRGIILYDRQKKSVRGTIDTQAIDCIYFDSETVHTCVVKEGDTIAVFNVKGGKSYGALHLFDSLGRPKGESQDGEEWKRYYRLWKANEKNYTDTFEQFHQSGHQSYLFDNNIDSGHSLYLYSERSKIWESREEGEQISFLSVIDGKYQLCTFSEKMKKWTDEEMMLSFGKGDGESALPEFVYTGDDPYIQPIISYLREKKDWYFYDEAEGKQVWIPAFVIAREVKKGDEYLVFGNFWGQNWRRSGAILCEYGGGDCPACFHLKKSKEGYRVVRADFTRDGAYYIEDIKNFTKDYPGLYKELIYSEKKEKEVQKAQKKFLRMYIKNNHLDIQYYKEPGGDPVKIF